MLKISIAKGMAIAASLIVGLKLILNEMNYRIGRDEKFKTFIKHCNPQRYTYAELKNTVGRTPSNLWSTEQVDILGCKFCAREDLYYQQKYKGQESEQKWGVFSIIASDDGPSAILHVNNNMSQKERYEKYYDLFKTPESEFIDDDYKRWVAAEIEVYYKRDIFDYRKTYYKTFF